jgi:hypothetical protein
MLISQFDYSSCLIEIDIGMSSQTGQCLAVDRYRPYAKRIAHHEPLQNGIGQSLYLGKLVYRYVAA